VRKSFGDKGVDVDSRVFSLRDGVSFQKLGDEDGAVILMLETGQLYTSFYPPLSGPRVSISLEAGTREKSRQLLGGATHPLRRSSWPRLRAF